MTTEQVVPVLMGLLVVSVIVHGLVDARQNHLWTRRVSDAKLEIYEAFIDRVRELEARVQVLETRARAAGGDLEDWSELGRMSWGPSEGDQDGAR